MPTPHSPTGDAVLWFVDAAGNVQYVGPANPLPTARGSQTAFIAGGSASPQVIKASPGRLRRIIITTAGSAALSFYDNASAASGNVLAALPATTTVGQIYEFDVPAAVGITAGGGASTPGYTAVYD